MFQKPPFFFPQGFLEPLPYDSAKEAAKPQWKKPKKEKENPKRIIFVSDEDEPEPLACSACS